MITWYNDNGTYRALVPKLVNMALKVPDFDTIFIVKLKNEEIVTKDLILDAPDYKDLVILKNDEADARFGKSNRKRR